MQTSKTPAWVLQKRSTVSSSRIRITSLSRISDAGRASEYPPFVPRWDCTRPALFKIHISLPALATDRPSRPAISDSVSNSPSASARANCTRHRKPYSSCAEIFILVPVSNRFGIRLDYSIPYFFVKYSKCLGSPNKYGCLVTRRAPMPWTLFQLLLQLNRVAEQKLDYNSRGDFDSRKMTWDKPNLDGWETIARDPRYAHFVNIPDRIIRCLDYFEIKCNQTKVRRTLRAYYLFIGVVDDAIDSGEIEMGRHILACFYDRVRAFDRRTSQVRVTIEVLKQNIDDEIRTRVLAKLDELY